MGTDTQTLRVLRRLQKKLGRCPTAGEGVHRRIYRAAHLLKLRCDDDTACKAIAQYVVKCGRPVSGAEIRSAVRKAWNSEQSAGQSQPPWPAKNPDLITRVTHGKPGLEKLRKASPVDAAGLTAYEIIDQLFPGECLLCVGTVKNLADTAPKASLRGCAERFQFVVPNRMSAETAKNQEGRRTRRCLNNTAERRFLVVECDPKRWADMTPAERAPFATEDIYIAAKKDEAAAILQHLSLLAPQLPLVLVVDSAGKSLHGWFFCEGQPEDELRRFFRYALALGADPATWTPCQFVRLPNAVRDTGKRQTAVYFNPAALN